MDEIVGASEEEIVVSLSEKLDLPIIILSKYNISPEVTAMVSEDICRYYHLIPMSKIGARLTVAMSNPMNVFAIDHIRRLAGMEVQRVIASTSEIGKAIKYYYGSVKDTQELTEEDLSKVTPPSSPSTNIAVEIEKEGIDIGAVVSDEQEVTKVSVKMVNLIIMEALTRRASDIHIEPYEEEMKVRYRIDGELVEAIAIPKRFQEPILARLKIMAALDVTQKRLPQDGRFTVRAKDKEVDLRVSSLPIEFGEKIVMRILDKTALALGLDRLGLSKFSQERLSQAVNKHHGMLLITGPTGSGKSTTLYSILSKLNSVERNILTIEDPVEYKLKGIIQVPVRQEIGLTFASGLRSILRQSPDIIMVGEIRDSETADIAIKSALTGHLVLSTLHTNDAASSITRLIDMGIEPFLIASSLETVIAQRLCRRMCTECKDTQKGCARCNHTGYYGRFAILEILILDNKIRNMILKRASCDEIKSYAVSSGMRTLREDALERAEKRETTQEEIARVTSET